MKLYFVRHGVTAWNEAGKVQGHTDIPLNEYGRYLAQQTAVGLEDVSFNLAYTSPLVRARETAEIILKGREVAVYVEPRIQEIGFGVCEGMCFRGVNRVSRSAEFNKFFTDTANYKTPEGGESFEQLLKRVQEFLEELYSSAELQDKTILIATHGAALTAMLNSIKGRLDVAHFWGKGVLKNCSVTEVNVENGKAEVIEEGKLYY